MTLKKGILWSQRKMRPQNVKRGGKYQGVMGKIMSNEKIAKALDRPGERKEFYGMLKSMSEGGVYKNELRKFFGDLRSGKIRTRTINAKEIRIIAKEIFPDSAKRYTFKESGSQKNTSSPGQNIEMFDEIRRGFSSSGGSHIESNTPQNVVAFRHEKKKPAKQYSPGDSLKYEFAKPGFQSEKELEKKKDAEIKPVAPEAYAKIPGTPQKTTETAEETNIAPPEGKRQETAKPPLSPENRERLKFPKSTLSGNTDSVSEKKDLLTGTKTAVSAIDNISANKAIQTEALIKSARRRMLAARESGGSEKLKRGFFGAMAATTKNKRS